MAERGIVIAIKGPIVGVFKVLNAGLAGLPTRGGTEYQRGPRHAINGFAIIVPGGIEHSDRAKFLAVAHKVADIDERDIEIGPHLTPITCARCHNHTKARVTIWPNDVFVAGLSIVFPRNRDHVLGQNTQELWILHGDITPEHELFMVRLEDSTDLLHVLEIHTTQPDVGSAGGRLSMAEFKGLVASDVQKRAGKKRYEVRVHGLDEIVRLLLGRGKHVPMRPLGDVRINFVLQHVMKVPEGLLFRKDGYIKLLCIGYNALDLIRRERCFLGSNQRLAREIEYVLHVKSKQIHLVRRQRADLAFHKFLSRDGTAADIVLHAAPLHAGPVAN